MTKTLLGQDGEDHWERLREELRAAYGRDAVSVDEKGRTVLTDAHGERFVFLKEEAYRVLAGSVVYWSELVRTARKP